MKSFLLVRPLGLSRTIQKAGLRLTSGFSLAGLSIWIFSIGAIAQPEPDLGVWSDLDRLPQNAGLARAWVAPHSHRAVQADEAALRQVLDRAPLEFTAQARAPADITLPMPDGTFARFHIVESPVMAPGLAAKFPELKTYVGQGIDDPRASARLDWTRAGFHAQILSPRGAVYIDPLSPGDRGHYASYYKRDYRRAADGFVCLTTSSGRPSPTTPAALLRSGDTLRTYRLACAATGEYTQFHGGTVVDGMAAIVTAVNRVTGVYEQEVAVRMVLVANNDLIVYTSGNTDPYSNDNGSQMLSQNQSNLDSVIGSANYDIGHVFSTGGGGVAYLGAVCDDSIKAGGVTGLPSPIGDPFYIDFVAHEMGHQFGADHTFNSITASCGGGNRNGPTAYEPGSGSTIMAYAGICGTDDLQPNSDPYFHSASFDQIQAHITGAGNSCAVQIATSNSVPTVSAGPDFTVPQGTPFTLTAGGSDPDGDILTYGWEERDLGPDQDLNDPDNGSSPLFRSFNPELSPSRTFPKLASILNNAPSVGERLPTTGRTMNFRVTARDNRSGGGGVDTDDMQVTVHAGAGPFVLTFPNAATSLAGVATVTWDVGGTDVAPVSATHVNILVSTNSGSTFPLMLISNTPNDGVETIVLPNTFSTTARIKVEGTGNIFFDVADADFSINFSTPTPLVAGDGAGLVAEGCAPTNGAADPGETVVVDFALKNIGTGDTTNLVATLLAGGGVNVPSGPQSYGVLEAGGAAVKRSFSFTAGGACGGTIAAVLQLQDGAKTMGTVTNHLALGVTDVTSNTFANSTTLEVPDKGVSGPGGPYPSTIDVSGFTGAVTEVTVTLVDMNHAWPDDIDLLLAGPGGETVTLMSDAGGGGALNNVTVTLDDAAATSLPDSSQIVSGTYRPANYEGGDTFPSPAPAGPYGAALSSFVGTDPNGTWSLYAVDDSNRDKGEISGGWSLSIVASTPAACCTNSVNTPPSISDIGDQATDEDTATAALAFDVGDVETVAGALQVIGASSDTNLVPNGNLVFGGSDSNRTLTITPASNLFGSTTISVTVDDGMATAIDTFELTVNSVNDPPVLDPIASRTAHFGGTITFTNAAADGDEPPDSLTFSLDPGAPAGTAITATNGVFSWTPGPGDIGTSNFVTVRVTDDGTPSLDDSESFTIVVMAGPEVLSITSTNDTVTVTWSAISGQTYRVIYKGSLQDIDWLALPGDVTATGPVEAKTDTSATTTNRFYTIVVLP